VGAAVINLCERGIFDEAGRTNDVRLKVAWRRFRRWCRGRGVESNARSFTQARLTWNTAEFAESTSKAMNTRILVAWIADEAALAPDADLNTRNQMVSTHLFNLNELHLAMEDVKAQFFTDAQVARFCNAGAPRWITFTDSPTTHVVTSHGQLFTMCEQCRRCSLVHERVACCGCGRQ
jgi:hypothetical protein